VKCLLRDSDQTLWIGTDRKLYYQPLAERSTTNVTPLTLDFTAAVNDIRELPGGTLVMATDGDGLAFVKDHRQVLTLTTQSGMSSNICTSIEIEDDGTIWVGTTNGVNKITGYPDSVHVDYLSVHDGLLSNNIVDMEIVKDTVWVASRNGLSYFKSDYKIRKITAPVMYVERVTLDGEPVYPGENESLSFSHRQNDIGIRYVGLLYGNGDPLLYRYRLHDTDPWRYTKSTSVYLPGLNPDTYQFTVSAQGRSGQWSEEARVTFEIKNPFWRSNAFSVGIIVLVLGVGGWSVRRYISHQQIEMQRQQRVVLSELKTLRAQMNPHFLFNALNSIQGVLLKRDIESAQEYLIRFGKLMRLILDHSDRASITIREELDSIVNYLEIEQLRSGHQFRYRIEFDSEVDIERSEIPAMILQPFIENSIWHGFGHSKDGSELLVIRFSKEDENIFISITDNGIGRKKALTLRKRDHKSKGIQLVKERIEILNFNSRHKIELHVEDLEDEHGNHPGTRVTIKIPLIAR
jgi:two-component sensor histidine kinase